MNSPKTFAGQVALVGQPNVGKSTLLNALLGQKISITSRKPQTTRQRVLGIKTHDNVQIIYIDTPGIHQDGKKVLNRLMNRAARQVLKEVNVIVFLIEAGKWNEGDAFLLKQLEKIEVPVILAINKIDRMKDRQLLLPQIEKLSTLYQFHKIIPISAAKKINLEQLEKAITDCLPEEEFYYSPDQLTDRSDRFMAAEFIREKLTRLLGEELPYALTVMIENFSETQKLIRIDAVIVVERPGQKAIVIGKGGGLLKQVGEKARLDLEKYYDKKVFLKLWVKIKEKWSDREDLLRQFGYKE